ncbi:major facilitator transporter [Bifidobacterium pseudolongum subsp. globosum]|uniref:MFS transporter n=1 Tax=Bifidobacterium pseudolongum TaxID=1694 RepID=UPI0010CE0EBF|nr:MFS transporter [Bifidobacterium pseudolongum]RYP96670.1 major facilitator transporter [Bifidobacterium pseudolongum subsp. globosum]
MHAPLVAVVGIAAVLAAGSAAAAITAEPVARRFGSGRTVDMGVALTVLALLGFSFAPHYWVLLVFALPYGIGSGMLVVALNAYVAVRSANARITWLHATTAFGALVGHTVLGWIIADGADWRWAYRTIGLVQLALAVVLAAGTRRWRDHLTAAQMAQLGETPYAQGDWRHDMRRPHVVRTLMAMPAAVAVIVLMFATTSVEQTTMLWASSYMVHAGGMSIHTAGVYANLFFVGLVAGSVVAGVVALKVRDVWMVVGGIAVLLGAVVLMVVPMAGLWRALTAPVLLGVGCAPIAPAVVHATPRLFGAARTPAMIGMQTAAVSLATLVSPVLFAGVERVSGSMHALPWYLLGFTVIALAAYARVVRVARLHARGE